MVEKVTAAARQNTKREKYPCTHYGSKEHIDPQCPQHPRNLAKGAMVKTTTTTVPAYYAEEDSNNDDLIPVNESLYSLYQNVYLTHYTRDSGLDLTLDSSENELGGRSGVVGR
jgi:hypothetical protein